MEHKLNILIPCAGRGSRFVQAGYELPKPLIDVGNGKPMIKLVVENLNLQGRYTFIVLKEHYDLYKLNLILEVIAPGCNIVQVDTVTEGAACTALLAKEFIDNDIPLVIANSDQFVEWDSEAFMEFAGAPKVDGAILVFDASGTKWSYVLINDTMQIVEVAEKKQISDQATVGIYYFRKGSDFVAAAERMIRKGIRTNGEFYICPVYSQLIEDGKRIWPYWAEKMWGLGDPETLNQYLNR